MEEEDSNNDTTRAGQSTDQGPFRRRTSYQMSNDMRRRTLAVTTSYRRRMSIATLGQSHSHRERRHTEINLHTDTTALPREIQSKKSQSRRFTEANIGLSTEQNQHVQGETTVAAEIELDGLEPQSGDDTLVDDEHGEKDQQKQKHSLSDITSEPQIVLPRQRRQSMAAELLLNRLESIPRKNTFTNQDKKAHDQRRNTQTETDLPMAESSGYNTQRRRNTDIDTNAHRGFHPRERRQSLAAEFLSQRLEPLPRRQTLIGEGDQDPVHIDLESLSSLKDGSETGLQNDFHKLTQEFVDSRVFGGFILGVILVNTAILIAQTWPAVAVRAGWYFTVIDCIFLGIYTMEMVLKLYVFRSQFFHEGWNILDLSIVIVNIVDFSLPMIITNIKGFNGAAIFRLLRIFRAVRAIRALRVLRTIRFLQNLQVILGTLLQSIRSIGAIVTLITLVMYMFAVIGRGLYAKEDPEHFGTIFNALFTLFQLLTLDDWFDIHQTIASQGRRDIIAYLWLYIVVEYFVFLNLFVAVLVDNFQLTLEAQSEANKNKKKDQNDDDDEEDYFLYQTKSKPENTDPELKPERKRKSIAHYYPSMKEGERDTLEHYFQLLASLECNTHALRNHQRLLNIMTDICQDTQDEV